MQLEANFRGTVLRERVHGASGSDSPWTGEGRGGGSARDRWALFLAGRAPEPECGDDGKGCEEGGGGAWPRAADNRQVD